MNTPAPRSQEPTERIFDIAREELKKEPVFSNTSDIFDREKIEQAVQATLSRIRSKIEQLFKFLTDDAKSIIQEIAERENADILQVAAEWVTQQALFLEIGSRFGLKEVAEFERSSPSAFIAISMNSSILSGSAKGADQLRDFEYIRMPTRKESWGSEASSRRSVLVNNVQVGITAHIPDLVRTSQIARILVIPGSSAQSLARITDFTRHGMEATMKMR